MGGYAVWGSPGADPKTAPRCCVTASVFSFPFLALISSAGTTFATPLDRGFLNECQSSSPSSVLFSHGVLQIREPMLATALPVCAPERRTACATMGRVVDLPRQRGNAASPTVFAWPRVRRNFSIRHYAAPASRIEYVTPAPDVDCTGPAPVTEYVDISPAVTYAAPAPMIDYAEPAVTDTEPAPVNENVAPAPAVSYAAPAPRHRVCGVGACRHLHGACSSA